MQSITEEKPGCIGYALSILGDKWTTPIVRELTECPKKFSELELALPGISPRTLSQRLRKLTAEKIVLRQEYCARPPRAMYALTPKGSELKLVIQQMSNWGARYH